MATTKISPYDLPSLKNTTDDALQNYLTSIGFAQSHYLTDIRLALGYVAVLIGAGTFVADYKLGWDATKDWTAVAVVVYFALNGAFTYWIWAVERGMVFEGERKGGKVCRRISLFSSNVGYGLMLLRTCGNGLDAIEVEAIEWNKPKERVSRYQGTTANPRIADPTSLPHQKVTTNLLPQHHQQRPDNRAHRTLHDLVHRRRLLRSQAVPAMDSIVLHGDWRGG